MAEANQVLLDHKELLELLIKHTDIHEGKWILMASFGMAPGNYGPTPEQTVPGIAIAVQTMGIQRAGNDTPAAMILDASVVNPPPTPRKKTAPKRRTKKS